MIYLKLLADGKSLTNTDYYSLSEAETRDDDPMIKLDHENLLFWREHVGSLILNLLFYYYKIRSLLVKLLTIMYQILWLFHIVCSSQIINTNIKIPSKFVWKGNDFKVVIYSLKIGI